MSEIVEVESHPDTDLWLGMDEKGYALFGASSELLYYLHPNDIPLLRQIIARLEELDEPELLISEVHMNSWCTEMRVILSDGRSFLVDLTDYPEFEDTRAEDVACWCFNGRGEGIRWPNLDIDLSLEGLMRDHLS